MAKKTIGDVLAGTFATDDDKTAVESAVRTLVAHPSADNDALLVRLLLTVETVRSADHQGPWPARELQAKTFELIEQSQSCGLRTGIAEAVVERREPIRAEDPLHGYLLEDNPLNCGAQVVICRKGLSIKPETKTKLDAQLLKYSSLALGRYLGVPDQFQVGTGGFGVPAGPPPAPTDRFGPLPGGPQRPGPMPGPGLPSPSPLPGPGTAPPGGQTPKPAEVDLAAELAGQLWTKEFRATFESELGKSSLDKQAQLLLLAATIPQDSTRALLVKALNKRAVNEEPTALKTAGFVDKAVTDPALLVPLKMLPWKDLKPGRAGATVDKSKLPEAKRKEQECKEKWRDFSQEMAEGWCKRLYAAAQARDEKQRASGEPDKGVTAVESRLPPGFRFRVNTIKASYRLKWPDEAPPELVKLNPGLLSVYYIRVEENAKPKKTAEFYSGQAGARKNEVLRHGQRHLDLQLPRGARPEGPPAVGQRADHHAAGDEPDARPRPDRSGRTGQNRRQGRHGNRPGDRSARRRGQGAGQRLAGDGSPLSLWERVRVRAVSPSRARSPTPRRSALARRR